MININVWSEKYLEIESNKFEISDRDTLILVIEHILNKAYYGGERICLEKVEVEDGKNLYTTINRW